MPSSVSNSQTRHIITNLAIVNADAAGGTKRADQVKRGSQGGGVADSLDNHVSPAALGGLHDLLAHVVAVCKVQRHCTQLARYLESAFDTVNCEKVSRASLECAEDGAEANWATAHDNHGRLLDINGRRQGEGALDTEIPGGKDVGHEQQSPVGYGIRGLEDGPVRQRHPHVLCLAAI